MNANIKTARIVAVFFIIALILPSVMMKLVDSFLDAPNYLAAISENETQVIVGALIELVNGILIAGIGIAMYPILKPHNISIALWYAGFRIVEFATHVINVNNTLSLVSLSRESVQAGAPDADYFQTLGNSLLAGRHWDFLTYALVYCAGALMFYYLLYRSKLVPRWISAWGFVAVLLCLTAAILGFFGLSYQSTTYILLAAPIALNELTLSIWLIVKGFNSSASAYGPAK